MKIIGYLDVVEQNEPLTPSSGKVRVYPKTDGRLYYKDSNGEEYLIGKAGSYKIKEIESGSWDMDTFATKSVPHGLDYKTIKFIAVDIRNDDDDERLGLSEVGYGDHGFVERDATDIIMQRVDGGHFDSTTYSKTTGNYNRAYITIFYK